MIDEYLRRNLLLASTEGSISYAKASIAGLRSQKKYPKWLMKNLVQIVARLEPVSIEMARHRDEVEP